MTNILQISVRADVGGGPEHLFQLINTPNDAYTFHVACPKDRPYWSRFSKATNEKVVAIPHRKFSIRSLIKLHQYIKRNRISLIHAHGKGAGLYGRILALTTQTPCLLTPHGIHVGSYNRFKKTLYRLYENITAVWLSHIIFVSESEMSSARQFGLWPRVPSSVIPNGVPIVPDISISQLRSTNDTTTIGVVSRYDYQKNMDEAYIIAKLSPHLNFIWFGDGDDRARLQMRAGIEDVRNIEFAGFVNNVPAHLAKCDIILSTSRWEGLPLGLLEGMSVGLPCIASDVIGNRDAVANGVTGFLYQLGNPSEAVNYINQLYSNNNLLKTLSKNSLNVQRNRFSTQTMAHATFSLYKSILQTNSHIPA